MGARAQERCDAVVGAIIDLGNCLNLTSREGLDLIKRAFQSYSQLRQVSGERLPTNHNPLDTALGDRLIRRLDNAVIEHLHALIDDGDEIVPFDTVRCLFPEGEEAYPGAMFRMKSHIQVAVRNPDCIIGYFRPRQLLAPQ